MLPFSIRHGAVLAGTLACVLASAAMTPAADPAPPVAGFFDDPTHLDELAAYVQQTSNALCWELHRYHQHEPDFRDTYRAAKDVWGASGAIRDALRDGPIDPAMLATDVARMNEAFARVDQAASHWGDGIRPAAEFGPRSVMVTPGAGVDVDIPFIGGFRVGSPRVFVNEEVVVPGPARVFHPHARGSKRALERELFAVRTALEYLTEDTGFASPESGAPTSAPPAEKSDTVPPPRPAPPSVESGPALSPPIKIGPPSAKKTASKKGT